MPTCDGTSFTDYVFLRAFYCTISVILSASSPRPLFHYALYHSLYGIGVDVSWNKFLFLDKVIVL